MRKEPLKITERSLDGITVFELDGDLALENNAQFRTQFTAALDAGTRKVIVNMAGVDYMDSSGLGELVSCYTALQKVSGRFTLLQLNERLQRVLVITKLYTVFETFESEAAAVDSFPITEISVASDAIPHRQLHQTP
ncbi:MAG: STAS domain-containing protein [Acidobacteria bacterium]|nr:STAS domain-containing protein [Acidobacteriota bacterium]